jgi:hypothetical protein
MIITPEIRQAIERSGDEPLYFSIAEITLQNPLKLNKPLQEPRDSRRRITPGHVHLHRSEPRGGRHRSRPGS